jgi:ceramide glucosyltransferase
MVALLVTGVGAFLLLMAVVGSGFSLHAARALARYGRPTEARSAAPQPDVTLIKPLHGEEPGLAQSLTGFLAQDYAGAVELRLGLQSPDDPALAVARAMKGRDGRAVRVVLDATQHGANRKVSNLINLAHAAPLAELVVQSDSDMAVSPDYLAQLAQALEAPGVGLASCLYLGEAARPGLAARLGAMFVSYSGLPLFAVGVSLGAKPSMGSTIALRRETLQAVGGFESVKDVLADDYELGVRVRALGLQSVVPPFLVTHRHSESTLGELWRHEMRWSKTVSQIDRWGHLGSVVTHPLPLALLGWLCLAAAGAPLNGSGIGAGVVLLALAARLWLKSRVDAAAVRNGASEETGPWWLLPGRDMLSIAVFVCAYLAQGVEWRGARFHLGRGGALTPV